MYSFYLPINNVYPYDMAVARLIASDAVYAITNTWIEPHGYGVNSSDIGFHFEILPEEMVGFKNFKRDAKLNGIFLRKFLSRKRYTPPHPFGIRFLNHAAYRLKIAYAVERLDAGNDGFWGKRAVRKIAPNTYYIIDDKEKFIVLIYVDNIEIGYTVAWYLFGVHLERLEEKYKAFVLAPLAELWATNAEKFVKKFENLKDMAAAFADYEGPRTLMNWFEEYKAYRLLNAFIRGEKSP